MSIRPHSIHHVNFPIQDPERTKDWYSNVFGMREVPRPFKQGGATVREAVFRAILAEQHAAQVLTALSHGRPLSAVPETESRAKLYERMLPPFTHDMNWWYEASFVPEPAGAHVH